MRADRRRDVSVGGQLYSAATVILATGSSPRSIPGVEFGERIIGTEQAWALKSCPRAWLSSAPARPAPRSPPATRALAPTSA